MPDIVTAALFPQSVAFISPGQEALSADVPAQQKGGIKQNDIH
ncbi:hypothetical protein C7434_2019 [Pantoea sp. PNA 14-12]|nr:hypothetical protein [Pantoea stewartii]TDS70141.1 hypothetical protein C7434_2019 [Pantoea sp. PNA 14-12]